MDKEETLKRIREVRTRENVSLKPSPYLRDSFVDEYGDTHAVKIRNYQSQGVMNLLMMERSLLGDDTGLGKAQPVDSRVMTPSGWRLIGDLKVGDRVIGSNGLPIEVSGIFPQGQKQTYRVTMSDDSSTECCEDHLWTVRSGNTRRSGDGWRTFPLKYFIETGLKRQKNGSGKKWSIPVVSPIQFEEKDLPVDPYLVGVLIGDGSMPIHVSVCNGDPELFSLVEHRLPSDVRLGDYRSDGFSRPIVGKSGVRNSLVSGLIKIGLMKTNWNTKFIPESYKTASVSQRIELLRGLMDTDGYLSKDGKVTQFFSSNLGLVRDFIELVQSLGGTAWFSSKIPTLRGKSKAKRGKLAYTVTISLPNSIIPFHLSRKVSRWKPRTKYPPTRYISKIEKSRVEECVCIRVDASDSLYVTDDFIVTHNTLMVLSTIGYVWMKEPEYVPIIITTKSALFQWGNEVKKFMKDMEVVTVHGEPYERHEAYGEFFWRHDPEKKRLIILTYDNIMYDMAASVVKDKSQKPPKGWGKEIKAARERKKERKEYFEACKSEFRDWFEKRSPSTHEYLSLILQPLHDSGLYTPVAMGKPQAKKKCYSDVSHRLMNM